MSLYNALFGTNPYAGSLLLALGAHSVPRFRDCYLDEDGTIVIYTRTGGGNREYYDAPNDENKGGPWNSTLRAIPGFLRDEDDDFDNTYARFYFAPPQELADIINEIKDKQGKRDPSAAFQQLLADLRSEKDTPETKRAKDVGERIFGKIAKETRDGGPTIIEV